MEINSTIKSFIVGAALVTGGMMAHADVKTVVVTDAAGNSTSLAFSAEPRVTFTTASLVVTASETVVEYPLTSRVSFTFSDTESSVEDIMATSPLFYVDGEVITVKGLAPGETVQLYGIDGALINATVTDIVGCCTLTNPRRGQVVIVKTATHAIKVK